MKLHFGRGRKFGGLLGGLLLKFHFGRRRKLRGFRWSSLDLWLRIADKRQNFFCITMDKMEKEKKN